MIVAIITLMFLRTVLAAPPPERHHIVARDFWHHLKHSVEKVAHHVGHAVEDAAVVALTQAAIDVIVGKRTAALESTNPWICLKLILELASEPDTLTYDGTVMEDLIRHCEGLSEKVEHPAVSAIETSTGQSIVENRGGLGNNFKEVVLNVERKGERYVEEFDGFFLSGLAISKHRSHISELQTLRERLIQWLEGHIQQTHGDHDAQNTTTLSNHSIHI